MRSSSLEAAGLFLAALAALSLVVYSGSGLATGAVFLDEDAALSSDSSDNGASDFTSFASGSIQQLAKSASTDASAGSVTTVNADAFGGGSYTISPSSGQPPVSVSFSTLSPPLPAPIVGPSMRTAATGQLLALENEIVSLKSAMKQTKTRQRSELRALNQVSTFRPARLVSNDIVLGI